MSFPGTLSSFDGWTWRGVLKNLRIAWTYFLAVPLSLPGSTDRLDLPVIDGVFSLLPVLLDDQANISASTYVTCRQAPCAGGHPDPPALRR